MRKNAEMKKENQGSIKNNDKDVKSGNGSISNIKKQNKTGSKNRAVPQAGSIKNSK